MDKFVILAGNGSPLLPGHRLDSRINEWSKMHPTAHIIDWQFSIDTSTPSGNQFICIRYFDEAEETKQYNRPPYDYSEYVESDLEPNERERED